MNSKRFDEDSKIREFLAEHLEGRPTDDFKRSALNHTKKIFERRNRKSRYFSLALKGALAVAGVIVGVIICRNPHATTISPSERSLAITSVTGQVWLDSGRKLAQGDRVEAGATLRTGGDSRVTLVSKQGSLICLDSNTEFSIAPEGSGRITKGRLYCSNREHEIKSIEAPGGKILLLGTVLDTHVLHANASAVTVVEGKVKLSNAHGTAIVGAGNKSVLASEFNPGSGGKVNTVRETAWFDRRNQVTSDTGLIAYIVRRGASDEFSNQYEVWVMNSDGSGKRLVRTYVSDRLLELGYWCPGKPWVVITGLGDTIPPLDGDQRHWGVSRLHLLNVVTGIDTVLTSPKHCILNGVAPSPDGNSIAYVTRGMVQSLYLYDLSTCRSRVLMSIQSRSLKKFKFPSWTLDGRKVGISVEKVEDRPKDEYFVFDTRTGSRTSFPVMTRAWEISPDGKSVAGISYGPTREYIWVSAIRKGSKPIKASSEYDTYISNPDIQQCLSIPKWSRDGKRLLYAVSKHSTQKRGDYNSVFIANADGSGTKRIYVKNWSYLEDVNWAPDGKSVYIRTISNRHTDQPSTIKIAADSSGAIADLGGNDKDSSPSSDSQSATRDLTRAMFYFESGQIRLYEGNTKEARQDFRETASIFVQAAWKYPKSGLDHGELIRNFDTATGWANMTDENMLKHTCKERILRAACQLHDILLKNYDEAGKPFPTMLPKLKSESYYVDVFRLNRYGKPMVANPVDISECAGNGKAGARKFIYHPVTPYTKRTDVLLSCPNHPGVRILVDSFAGEWLAPWQARQKKHK